MSSNIKYDSERDCVIGNFSGKLDKKAIKEYAEKIETTISKHDCNIFLHDMREADLDFSTFEIYNLPWISDESGFKLLWKGAIVASRQVTDYKFFETLANNRGYQVKVFGDPDRAMHWLKQ